MTNEINNYNKTVFESIKHIDDEGREYWLARELQVVLEYKKWDKFINVIDRAVQSCRNSNKKEKNHFLQAGKLVTTGDSKRIILDYKLSRYACYLIVQNSDSSKKVVALGQTYFAVQTRKQELLEIEYESLSEDEKRLYNREITKKGNLLLNQAAKNSGVRNFDKFHNAGYRGLYNGETADDIAKRKKLRYREDILDNMGSSELIANMFRIDQTKQKLVKDRVDTESIANKTHYYVGKKVRKTIKDLGGTMPEDLPTPNKSLKQLEKSKQNLVKENFYD